MTDMFTPRKRSWIMRRITAKNTQPELRLRGLLHAQGLRFRLHRRDLPGCPDIVLPKYRTAIFVHGCFWHGHTCKDGRRPRSNRPYWNTKLSRNAHRDAANLQKLRKAGWSAIVVWACQLRSNQHVVNRIIKRLEAHR